jgi:predicted DNA-binding transcriptional regulator YafY
VELRFRLSALEEVRAWILGFAGHAEALAPSNLRQAVVEAAQARRASDRARTVCEGLTATARSIPRTA